MAHLSDNSKANLVECVQPLQAVVNEAIQYYDFSVVCGHRDEETQTKVFDLGVSKVQWPDSKHNYSPSRAFDAYPWSTRYGSLTEASDSIDKIVRLSGASREYALAYVREEYCMMAMVFKVVAQARGYTLRWGGDWDGDLDRLDQDFNDLAHFEFVPQD